MISRVFAGPSPSFALRRSFFTHGTPIPSIRPYSVGGQGTDEAICAGVYSGERTSFRPFIPWSASALLPAARTFSRNVDSDIVAAVNSPSSVAPADDARALHEPRERPRHPVDEAGPDVERAGVPRATTPCALRVARRAGQAPLRASPAPAQGRADRL